MTLRLAVLSVHTCPLAPLGGWETGGMNVYVRELSRELGRMGVEVDIFTRSQDPTITRVVPMADSDGESGTLSWDDILRFSRHAEGIGFDSLWVCDHFLSDEPGGPL